jgi:hypothetical protein
MERWRFGIRTPVRTTRPQPITLCQRKAMLVKYREAKITASPASTPQKAFLARTRGKKGAG